MSTSPHRSPAPPSRAPIASVQGTLALDLTPRQAPPEPVQASGPGGSTGPFGAPGDGGRAWRAVADVVDVDPALRGRLEQWVRRFVQATVEIVGGDRPTSQLLRWTSSEVYADLHRRATLVARAGGHQPGVRRVQPVRPHVESVHTSLVSPSIAETTARVRYGARSRALAARFERRHGRWICTALEFA